MKLVRYSNHKVCDVDADGLALEPQDIAATMLTNSW